LAVLILTVLALSLVVPMWWFYWCFLIYWRIKKIFVIDRNNLGVLHVSFLPIFIVFALSEGNSLRPCVTPVGVGLGHQSLREYLLFGALFSLLWEKYFVSASWSGAVFPWRGRLSTIHQFLKGGGRGASTEESAYGKRFGF
jgi:hypothetical protein